MTLTHIPFTSIFPQPHFPHVSILSLLRETYFLVGRAELDCLEGGTHEETLRPLSQS